MEEEEEVTTLYGSKHGVVSSTWKHGTDFIKTLNGPGFFDLKTPCSFWGGIVVQMQTPDIAEIFTNKQASLKLDGERHILILFVEQSKQVRGVAMTRSGRLMDVVDPDFCFLHPVTSKMKPGYFTILDTEYIVQDERHYWIAFDCLVFRATGSTKVCSKKHFTERYQLLQKTLTEDFVSSAILIKPFSPVIPGEKDFTHLMEEKTKLHLHGLSFPSDGLIFQPTCGPYTIGTNMNLTSGRGLKWKPECTLDMIPEPMRLSDIQRIHHLHHGEKSTSSVQWDALIRPIEYFGFPHFVSSVIATGLVGTQTEFVVPPELCKLKCVSDFSFGTNAMFTVVACGDVPLCVNLPVDQQCGVKEFVIDKSLIPTFRNHRPDKAPHQANKARTVAGVLWQASDNTNIDDMIENPSRLPPGLQISSPEKVSLIDNMDIFIPFDDFIRSLNFDRPGAVVENEFKLIQTKRPRAGNIFPAFLEANYENAPFVDALHFQRAIDGLLGSKYGKADPPTVTTIDFIVDNNLRLTAYERIVETRSGKPLSFFETQGFYATRKSSGGRSAVVTMPDVLKASGYAYRMDSRSEAPELFYLHDYLPDSTLYNDFLKTLSEQGKSGRKRKAENPSSVTYTGYRFVDKQEFEPEVETNIPLERIRRVSMESIRVGERVQASYRYTGQYHPATITKLNLIDRTVEVRYDYAVRSLSDYAKRDTIPLVIDALPKNTMVRIKKRKTFEFPGFRVDLTRTKNVYNFTSSSTRRLHHLTNKCDNCEVEIELLSSITKFPAFVGTLKGVLVDLLSFMKLDENSFLFDRILEAKPSEALQQTLTAYAKYSGYSDTIQHVDDVFLRALTGTSRTVKESDFHSTFDVAVMELFGHSVRAINSNDAVDESTNVITQDILSHLSPWVDVSQTNIEDFEARYYYRAIMEGNDKEYTTRQSGIDLFGLNQCWGNPGETFPWLCGRLKAESLLALEDDNVLLELQSALFGISSTLTNPFFVAPVAFGKEIARSLILDQHRAWWDDHEVALVWNDIFDFAHKFSVSLYYNKTNVLKLWGVQETERASIYSYHVHRDIAKLAVVVGVILACRGKASVFSNINDFDVEPCLASTDLCYKEYNRYFPRGVRDMYKPNVSVFENVPVCYQLL